MSEAAISDSAALADEDIARADFYALLAALFAAPPDGALLAAIANAPSLATAETQGEDAAPDLAACWDSLRAASANANPADVRQEYDDLFIGVGKSPVNLHGSHWLAGFMMDRPLADVRETLAELGLARKSGVNMVEDHLSALLETMRLLVAGDVVIAPSGIDSQRAFFRKHITPWYAECCTAIWQSPIANYYRAVAQFAQSFLALERDSIAME